MFSSCSVVTPDLSHGLKNKWEEDRIFCLYGSIFDSDVVLYYIYSSYFFLMWANHRQKLNDISYRSHLRNSLSLRDRLSHHRSSVFQSVCLKLSNISWKWRPGVGWNLFVSLKWRTAMLKLKHWVNYSHYIGASNEKNNPITEFLIKQSTTPSKTGRKCDFNSKNKIKVS